MLDEIRDQHSERTGWGEEVIDNCCYTNGDLLYRTIWATKLARVYKHFSYIVTYLDEIIMELDAAIVELDKCPPEILERWMPAALAESRLFHDTRYYASELEMRVLDQVSDQIL